jgi:MATE family multidrug resistance protein
MLMGIVDIAMVGRLGPEAIGAVGVGSALFLAIAVAGMGLLLGLDPLVAQAYGGGRLRECRLWLFHGVALAVLASIPLMLIARAGIRTLPVWDFDPAVLRPTTAYLRIVVWSTLPLLLYAAFRRYLQAIGHVRPVMVALVSANLINAAANWVLVFGKFGVPPMGVEGAAWATCMSRVYLAAVLLATIVYHDRRARTGLWAERVRIDLHRMSQLIRLGLPAAAQLILEVGVFAVVTALAGRLAPITLAAHQVVLNVAGFTFMVPLGIGSAGAVRVGQALGRRDPASASSAGWAALALGAAFMVSAAVTFVLFPQAILGLFSADAGVIAIGTTLLFVAAAFQLFDGLQGVGTGVLRGLGDTRTPMLWNLAGHWLIGLPLAYLLCFVAGWGVVGLWIGLSVGLILVGIVLLATWHRRTTKLTKG